MNLARASFRSSTANSEEWRERKLPLGSGLGLSNLATERLPKDFKVKRKGKPEFRR